MGKCIRKGIAPMIGFMMILIIFKGVYIVDGNLNWFRLWMLIGIPFGLTRIMIWVIPKGLDIGCSIGIFVFGIIVSGLVGGFIAIFTLIESVLYIIITPFCLLSERRKLERSRKRKINIVSKFTSRQLVGR